MLTEVGNQPKEHIRCPVNWNLHGFMLAACAFLVIFSLLASWLTLTSLAELCTASLALLLVLPPSVFPALVWHDARKYERRDAALTLPWIVSLAALIPFPVTVAARMRFPLRDAVFVRLDHALGFSVPAVMQWVAQHHGIGTLLDHCYQLLFVLIILAALLPALTGRKKAAEGFLFANAIAFLIGLPIFTLLPAIGPWAGYHFAASTAQKACEASISALRGSSQFMEHPQVAGIVCFPSFHVVWAILSAVALWSVKWLRIPASIFAVMIVLSTMTTGWHYGIDVLGGIALAAISFFGANVIMRCRTLERKRPVQ